MNETITYRIGFDVAKGVFQVHAVKNELGEPVAFTKRLKRAQVEAFFAKLPRSLIGMEACGSAHYWARVARRYGHEVRLMPPAYVKPYVKRNNSDPLDAEAICEAVGPHQQAVYMTAPETPVVTPSKVLANRGPSIHDGWKRGLRGSIWAAPETSWRIP
jgi:transposase